MSFVFPNEYAHPLDVVSPDDLNYLFEEYASAINGCLREHNWQAAGIASRATLETGAAYAYYTTNTPCDHSIAPPVAPATNWDQPAPHAVDGHYITSAEEWSTILVNGNDGIPVETGDTTLWILFSCQYFPNEPGGIGFPSSEYGHILGITVDGNMITDSCLGALDLSNDKTGYVTYDSRMLTVEAVVRVAPGLHSVRPVIRSLFLRALAGTGRHQIQNRELIVLDMRR
jgi:hypothetical protein